MIDVHFVTQAAVKDIIPIKAIMDFIEELSKGDPRLEPQPTNNKE